MEYVVPNHYCLRHWAEWFERGMYYKTNEEFLRAVRNTMRRIRYAEKMGR